MATQPQPLTTERNALSYTLTRLMNEVNDLDSLCKYVPRLVSVAINAARIQAALESSSGSDETEILHKVLCELTTEAANEENATW